MKRILVLILTVILIITCFTACDRFKRDPNDIYDDISKIAGLTKEEYENCTVFTFNEFDGKATIRMNRKLSVDGVIYYSANLSNGSLNVKYDKGALYNDESLVTLTASENMPIVSSGGYVDGDEVYIIFETITPVSGEIIIAFTEDALKAVHKDLQLHEHTYERYQDKIGHSWTYTCGCATPPNFAQHADGDSDGKCDECEYFMGITDPPAPANHFLRNQPGCEWLNDIEAEDIAEVKTIHEYIGVRPGNLKNIVTSRNQEAIFHMFDSYYWLDTEPISKDKAEIDGGSAFCVKFILKNGNEKELYFNNGNYRDTNGNYYKLLYTPTIRDHVYSPSAIDIATDSFSFITYTETCEVYTYGNGYPELSEKICEINNLCALEFIEAADFPENLPIYAIKTGFGRLDIYGSVFFSFGSGNYKLINGDFYKMFEIASSPDYSLVMNDPAWLYEDLNSTYKAGETVLAKIRMAYDLGYLFLVNGKDIADCKDIDGLYWEFSFTMPPCDSVIDFKTYDGFLPDYNYGVLIRTYWLKNLNAEFVYVEDYYGQYESGAIVAMICSGEYDDNIWEEVISGKTIRYKSSNRITVLFEGEFYSLTEAYDNKYISGEDLDKIYELHTEFYSYLYN